MSSGENPGWNGNRWGAGRFCRLAVVCGLIVGIAGSDVSAQQTDRKKGGSRATPERQTLRAADGWPIYITYYKSSEGKEAPAVILLHMEGGNRLVWENGFAERLNGAGYAVVTVDLRKHGESKPTTGRGRGGDTTTLTANDYGRMVSADLEAVKSFLMKEHEQEHLNVRKTAIVAAGMSAPVAINFASRDWRKKPYDDAPTPDRRTPRGQDIRALILLSPDESVPGVSTGRSLVHLRNPAMGLSVLTFYGTDDKLDRGQAKRIHQRLAGIPANRDRMYLESYDTKRRGTDLLGQNLDVEKLMLGFLRKHLMELPGSWRSRVSRLRS